MSLRAFHIVFIGCSVVLAAFLAVWASGQYRAWHEMGYLVTCIGSLVTAAGLAVYAAAFQRKTRRL
jgi:hypothetical protein